MIKPVKLKSIGNKKRVIAYLVFRVSTRACLTMGERKAKEIRDAGILRMVAVGSPCSPDRSGSLLDYVP